MATCRGSGSIPIVVEDELICPACFGAAPMDRFRVSGTEITWVTATHEPISGLKYRCITCLQPQKAFGVETVCTAASGHSLKVYPFRCQACKGSVRVIGGLPRGYCEVSWGGQHQLDTAVIIPTTITAETTPVAKGGYKGRGRFNVKAGAKCSDCGRKLSFRDGMTKCLSCLSEEALRRAR